MAPQASEPSREVWAQIREVLLREWDPIGVKSIRREFEKRFPGEWADGAGDDEYDSYVREVFALLSSGAAEPEIAKYLASVEKECMSQKPDLARAQSVARSLLRVQI